MASSLFSTSEMQSIQLQSAHFLYIYHLMQSAQWSPSAAFRNLLTVFRQTAERDTEGWESAHIPHPEALHSSSVDVPWGHFLKISLGINLNLNYFDLVFKTHVLMCKIWSFEEKEYEKAKGFKGLRQEMWFDRLLFVEAHDMAKLALSHHQQYGHTCQKGAKQMVGASHIWAKQICWSNNFHRKRHFCIQGAYDNQILPVWLLPLISRSSSWNSLGAHDSRPRVRVAVLMLLHFKVLLMKLNIKQRDWGLGRPPNHVDSRALSIQPSKRTNLKQILMLCQQFQVRGLARAVAVIKSEQLGPRWPRS